jgi:hypothetical protein
MYKFFMLGNKSKIISYQQKDQIKIAGPHSIHASTGFTSGLVIGSAPPTIISAL